MSAIRRMNAPRAEPAAAWSAVSSSAVSWSASSSSCELAHADPPHDDYRLYTSWPTDLKVRLYTRRQADLKVRLYFLSGSANTYSA